MIFIFPHQAQALTIASVKFSLADIAGGLAGFHVDCILWTYFACCATIFEIVCYQEVISYIKCVVLASSIKQLHRFILSKQSCKNEDIILNQSSILWMRATAFCGS